MKALLTVWRYLLVLGPILIVISVIAPPGAGQDHSSSPAFGPEEDLAIAQLIDGQLLLIELNGRIEHFDVRSKEFFTLSRFAANGKQVVGVSGQTVVVLDDKLSRRWAANIRAHDIIGLALAPSGSRIAFFARNSSRHTRYIGVLPQGGPEEVLQTLPQTEGAEENSLLSWDPSGERIAFGAGGHIHILDVKAKSSVIVADGAEPSWSPDGRWIGYLSADGALQLLDVASGTVKSTGVRATVSSTAHWSPDSKYIFVNEEHAPEKGMHSCFTDSRFVVYRVADWSRRVVYEPCDLRDQGFAWITNVTEWKHAAAETAK
jgi:dipeptidyl aminopeptidase/acylaminoacyl peptidase